MRGRDLVVAAMLLLGNVAYAQPAAAPFKEYPASTPYSDLVVRAVAARDLPPRVTPATRPGLDEVVKLLRANKVTEARGQWVRLVPAAGIRLEVDVNALVQWVLRESYLETSQDLEHHADKVRYYNEAKKNLREELAAARAGRAVRETAVLPYRPGAPVVKKEAPRRLTQAERDAYAKSLAEKLESLGDDAQLANVDLQNVLQKQQQTLQMMSNVSKMLHDTAMSIIRKMGG